MVYRPVFAALLLVTLIACRVFDAVLSPTATPPSIASTVPTATPVLPATSAATVIPQPANTPETGVPAPAVDFDDLSPHIQAMLPEFAGDVNTVAVKNATHYFIEAAISPATEGLQLNGTQQIRYTNTEDVPLSEIYFHLYPNQPGYGGQMSVDTVRVNNQPAEPTLEADGSALRVPLANPLAPRETAAVSLSFTTTIPNQPQPGYNIFSYTNGTAALAGFYPAIAVFDKAGWHLEAPPAYGDATYLDTSLYQVRLTTPPEMQVVASGSMLESVSNPDGSKTTTFASGPMRDFYLVMRPDFKVASRVVDGVTVNSYYPPGLEKGGQLALDYAANALQIFNRRFGRYPYAEFDIVATPTTAGGVEYPGIVVIADGLYNNEGGFFEHAVAHEVAHQWWYGLVGNDQVNEPWLDESLTNYSAYIYWQETAGPEAAATVLARYFRGPYEQARNRGIDKPVLGPVAGFNQSEYGAIVYGKGSLFFHELRSVVGDEVNFAIMQTYFSNYKYGLVQTTNLLTTIEDGSGQNIDPLVETWLR